jgi:hypothetical protein
MNARRWLAVPFVVATAALWAEQPAAQTRTLVCGEPDTSTTPARTPRATLTLDGTSKTTITYGRDTKPETLDLLFAVTGCELDAGSVKAPSVEVRPKAGSPQLPAAPRTSGPNPPTNVIMLKNFTPELSTLEVELEVDAEAIDPDSYEAYVVLRAPYMVSTRTPIAISRSEDNWVIPALIGAVAGLLGFAWLALSKIITKNELTISWAWLVPFGLVAAGFGAFAVVSAWSDQDVWTTSANWQAAVVAGVTGATTGAMLTLIGVLFHAKTPDQQQQPDGDGGGGGGATPEPAPQPGPAPAP